MRSIEVPDFIRGLIFDCDGTLIDSMPLHMRGWEKAITSNGGSWDYQFIFSKKGMPEVDIVAMYNSRFGMSLNPAKIVKFKHEYFHANVYELKPIQNVVDVALKYHGTLPMAVVSGGVRKIVDLELASLGIKDYFQVVLTADDDIRPKPSPDMFLEAARQIRVVPKLCQVFEDGDLGLEAARVAGMLATDIRKYLD
jgi:HAD superfamily hydrolase (TIGR01509 family)